MLVTALQHVPQRLPPHRRHRSCAIAAADPRVKAELRQHPRALAYEYTQGAPTWQVSWFSHDASPSAS